MPRRSSCRSALITFHIFSKFGTWYERLCVCCLCSPWLRNCEICLALFATVNTYAVEIFLLYFDIYTISLPASRRLLY